ncbi:MAG: hypothetical protein FK730_17195 [Asgard group archaeon]|nr:hypothetical protein [Asgard group archaeon]
MNIENTLLKRIGYIVLKSFIFMVLFAILHYLYTLSPNPFFQVISGIDETVFQHLKMGFIGYLLLIGIDYLIIRKRVENKISFVFSRLISSLLVPWIIFIVWYLVPAFVGHEIGFGRELAWALIVVFLTGLAVSFVDENTEKFEYNLAVKIVIGILVVISLIIFIWFSFEIPWIDVFVLPHE